MKLFKIGLAALVIALLSKLLIGGAPDRNVDIAALIESGALVIDVRTPGEFSGAHVEGAVNIPHTIIAGELEHQAKDRPIILYCRSGARAASAKHTLENAGFTHVVNAGSLHRMHKLLGR